MNEESYNLCEANSFDEFNDRSMLTESLLTVVLRVGVTQQANDGRGSPHEVPGDAVYLGADLRKIHIFLLSCLGEVATSALL